MVNELIQVFRETDRLIIEILCKEYPLSKGAIFKRLTERHKRFITYQAVYKQVKNLKRMGVLETEGRFYKLNVAWLQKRKAFFDHAQELYETGGGRLEFPV